MKKRDPFSTVFNACTDGESIPDLVMMSRGTAHKLATKQGVRLAVYNDNGTIAFWIGRKKKRKK